MVAALVIGAVVIIPRWHAKKAAAAVCVTTPSAAQANGITYALSSTQASNAATIAAVARRSGLPDHAVTVALATALQESKLENLPYGDRDSLGLFQQRPSQGWGTPSQVQDPVYAAEAFYRQLVNVPGWQGASVTAAAQAVQRSAAPDAYADWEPEARALARALTGEVAAGLSCSGVPGEHPAISVNALATRELGRPIEPEPVTIAQGWADATWLVAHAGKLGLERVSYQGSTWTSQSGSWTSTPVAGNSLSLVTS